MMTDFCVLRARTVDRFWTKVRRNGDCLEWTSGVTKSRGYGVYMITPGVRAMAHRYAYEMLVGTIPSGLEIDHLCRNRRCVNPAHLEAVTGRENNRRSNSPSAVNMRKIICANGHPLNKENARLDKHGARRCRACDRLAHDRQRERKGMKPWPQTVVRNARDLSASLEATPPEKT